MWYVIQVVGGKEKKMLSHINKALSQVPNLKLFIPRYVCMRKYQGQWHQEVKELFPGYIFVDTQQPELVEKGLRIFVSDVKPVCIGGGFYPIRQDEEKFLRGMMNAQNEIGISIGNLVNGRLVAESGPLESMPEAVDAICKIDRHKRIAELKLSLWGKERRVQVGLEVKEKLTIEEY